MMYKKNIEVINGTTLCNMKLQSNQRRGVVKENRTSEELQGKLGWIKCKFH